MRESRGNPQLAEQIANKRKKRIEKAERHKDNKRLAEMASFAYSLSGKFGRAVMLLDLVDYVHLHNEFQIRDLDKYFRG